MGGSLRAVLQVPPETQLGFMLLENLPGGLPRGRAFLWGETKSIHWSAVKSKRF